MGKKRKDSGYNKGRFKEIEYYLKGLRAPIFKLLNHKSKYKYDCPICSYYGPFMNKNNRLRAKCPKCGELERARMAMLVINSIYSDKKASDTDVLHVSPENFLRKIFKDKYKTVWELKQKVIVDMASDRGKYICQSQSMNLFLESPSAKTLTSMHVYAWRQGLKTGIYYLRTRPASNALQFTVAPEVACESCAA